MKFRINEIVCIVNKGNCSIFKSTGNNSNRQLCVTFRFKGKSNKVFPS